MDEPFRCYRHPSRETRVSCAECGRGICPDCMVFGPVGIKCPEHAGVATGVGRVTHGLRQASTTGGKGEVAKALIGINVGVYLLQLALGAPVSGYGGRIWEEGVLYGPLVADGEWWRLFTSAFLHYGPFHLLMNMVALLWFGTVLEQSLGRGRFLLLYLVSGLAGSAGALVASPNAATVGASGAIFGIFGAALVLERQRTYIFGASIVPLLILNFAFTFFVPGISKGGHVGGFVGGALGILALSRFGRGHAVYGRPGVLGVAALLAIGVLSVAVAYWKVRGYA